MLTLLSATSAGAQSTAPDSAEIYERLFAASRHDHSAAMSRENAGRAKRSFALYEKRGDEAGQARALLLMAQFREASSDTVLPLVRRAITLLRRTGADSSKLAEAVGTLSWGLMLSNASLDSAAHYRAENLRLRQRFPSPADEPHELWSLGHAFFRRAVTDSGGWATPVLSDSALYYLAAAERAARIVSDSVAISSVYNITAIVWAGRGRLDSALVYSRKYFQVAEARSDERSMQVSLHGLIYYFTAAPVRSRTLGITQNYDSALVWARVAFRAMKRFGPASQLGPAWQLSLYHQRLGNIDSARFYVQWARVTATTLKDVNAQETARRALASHYDDVGLTDSSLLIRQESVRRAGELTGSDLLIRQLTAMQSLARSHFTSGNLDSALFWYRIVDDSVATNLRVRALGYGGSFGRAEIHRWRGETDSALTAYQRVRSSARTEDFRFARFARENSGLLGEAAIHAAIGNSDSARTLIGNVLKTMPEMRGIDSLRSIMGPLSALANIARIQGQPDSALLLDRRVLSVAEDNASVMQRVESHRALGEDYEALGALDSARVQYKASLTITDKWQLRPQAVLSLGSLASWYLSVDVPDSALVIARRAITLATETASPWLLADARYRLGIIFGALGQSDSAATYLEATLGQAGRPVGPSLVALGNLRLRMGQADTARALLTMALRSYRASGARPAIAQTLTSLSHVEQRLGRPDSALVIAGEALMLARATQNRLTEGRALAALGRARFMLGQTDSARAEYERSLAVFRATGFTRDARETLAELAELFRLRRAPGDLERATMYFDSAATTFDNARRRTGDDELAVTFAEQQTDIYGGWARAWLGRRTDVGASRATLAALGAVERGRGQALLQLLAAPEAAARPVVGHAGTDLALEADSLLLTVHQKKSAALSYLQAGDTLFAWFVRPDGTVELLPPQAITSDELARLITSARRSFAADDARSSELDPDAVAAVGDSVASKRDPADDLRRLAALLLPEDLRVRVPAGTPIIVVPHGAIASVPFAALATGGNRGTPRTPPTAGSRTAVASPDTTPLTLGARHPLRFAPSFAALRATERSTRVLVTTVTEETPRAARSWTATRPAGAPAVAAPVTRRRRSVDRTLLAQSLVVGNPSMPFVYSGRSSTRSQLRPLPGAEAESRSIALQLGARVLTGAAATETSVRRRMRGAPIIHFATHGLGFGTAAQARRSYVAFAPDSAQDGLLTLGELMDDRTLTLHAELVVLSACQTGLGNLRQAEGTIGLQRAFLAKGARSVLVSLWNVDDAATRLLMEHFYRAWLDPVAPRSKAVALQLAQAAVRRTPGFAHPRYWAAFQLVGAE